MGIVTWIISKLSLIKKNAEDNSIQALRKEIQKLQKENKELRKKFIVFPQKNNAKVPIKFFDENIEGVIIKNIRDSKKELYIAVAWVTSNTIMDELGKAKRRGVEIIAIIDDNEKNNRSICKLRNACNEVKSIVMSTGGNNYMHNKYCIIDNKKVIDGSYNWSNNAKHNLEHVIIIESRNVAKMYKDSFNKIYNNTDYSNCSNVYDELG